jgi:hypothetical protein
VLTPSAARGVPQSRLFTAKQVLLCRDQRRRSRGPSTLFHARQSFEARAALDIQDPSAWRNIRRTRQLKRPVGRLRKHAELNLFHGYPAELIAEWCCVALSTAHAYKSGRLKRGNAAEKLFRLHRDRLILNAQVARVDHQARRDR